MFDFLFMHICEKNVFLALYFKSAGKALFAALCKIHHPVKLPPATCPKSRDSVLQTDFTASRDALRGNACAFQPVAMSSSNNAPVKPQS
jgi:hypothetical protein